MIIKGIKLQIRPTITEKSVYIILIGPSPIFCQKVIDNSVICKKIHPRIGTKKHVDPHWNGYQHNEKSLDFLRASRNDQGKGIAKHQTDKGGEKSQPEGFQDHIQVGSFQEFGKIPQVKESVITSFPSVVNAYRAMRNSGITRITIAQIK